MAFYSNAKYHNLLNIHYLHHFSEQTALYLTHSIRTFALSLVGIFLPIYILNLSESYLVFNQNLIINGICWILIYFLARSFGTLLSIMLLIKPLFTTIKFSRAIALSLLLLVFEIFLWLAAKTNINYMIFAGLLSGVTITTYFIPFHVFFVKKFQDSTGHFGKKTGFRHFLVILSQVAGPLIGGVVITNFGFDILFMITIAFLLIAAAPVLTRVNEGSHIEHSIENIFKNFLFNKKLVKTTIALGSQGVESVIFTIFWPLVMLLTIKNFTEIGFINSVSTFLSAITTLMVGTLLDRYGSKILHAIGCVFNAGLHFIRALNLSPVAVYAVDFVDHINAPIFTIPNMSVTYEKSKDYNISDYMLYREFALHIPTLLGGTVLLAIFTVATTWKWIFIPAAIATLLCYLINFADSKKL